MFVLFGVGQKCYAADEKEIPLNFDTQLIRIFEVAQTAPAFAPESVPTDKDREVLARILGKLRNKQMMLKNVVYRTDMDVIRITWGDADNNDVIKVAYKIGKDPVLSNSSYADKRQVVDVKISYRVGDAYQYLRIQNMQSVYFAGPAPEKTKPAKIPKEPTFKDYRVEAKLTDQQCGFCHILAQNDGSPKGVFFPRYQEAYGDYKMHEMGSVFHIDHFTNTPAASAKSLGLPDMKEDFLYQRVNSTPYASPENTQFVRSLIELPQLVEVMARDNKKSTCVIADFGTAMSPTDVDNYVCADNAAQKLMVKITNPVLSSNKGPKEYTEPYFKKQ